MPALEGAPPAPKYTVQVSNAGGPLCVIAADKQMTTEEVKVAIESSTGIPAMAQRLHFGVEELRGTGNLGSLLSAKEKEKEEDEAAEEEQSIELLLVRRSEDQTRWLEQVKQAGPEGVCDWLEEAPPAAQEDPEVVLAAVAQNWAAMKFASAELRADPEFMLAALAQDRQAFVYAAAELKTDREFVLAAVAEDGHALMYASVELRADREIVLAAVRQYGGALAHAAAELKADPELLLAAEQRMEARFQR